MPENVASQRVLEKCGLRYEKAGIYYGVHARYFAIDRPQQRSGSTPA